MFRYAHHKAKETVDGRSYSENNDSVNIKRRSLSVIYIVYIASVILRKYILEHQNSFILSAPSEFKCNMYALGVVIIKLHYSKTSPLWQRSFSHIAIS